MSNLKFQPVQLLSIVAFALLIHSSPVFAIAKCQDAEGKWHYGDSAATVCGNTKITIINKKGIKVEEIDAPPTLEELNAEKEEERRKKLEAKQRNKREMEKRRILAIYPSEDSVIRARDDRLQGMDNNIRLQETLLGNMRMEMKALESKAAAADDKIRETLESRIKQQQENIGDYHKAITQLRREREQTAEKYEKILIEFRDLTAK